VVSKIKEHPAETAGPLAMAIAFLIGQLAGADAVTTGYIAIILSFVPAVVTWIVDLMRGGSVNAEDTRSAEGKSA
jgi:hypothetical protein